MANNDTIIVDIPSLEEAIASFTRCNNILGECVSSLTANSAQIQMAWKSDASNIYHTKMQKLSQNVGNAQTALQVKIKELSDMCEKSRAAEQSARTIAESLDSSFMI